MIDPALGYDPSENRQAEIRVTMISTVALAGFFIGLRFLARYKAGVHYGIDDWSLVVAYFSLGGLLAVGLIMVDFGLGTHTNNMDQIINVLKGLLAFECFYVLTVAIVKISLLLMYCRAFAEIRSVKIGSIFLGSLVVGWAIAIICVCIFQCTTIPRAWNPTITTGTCLDLKASFIGNAVPNVVTDILILALPIRHVWKLVPSKVLRIQLSVVFLLGSFVVFTSIYRFSTLFQFVPTDTPWTLATACAWCIVECATGIISVCLPTLGPLLQFAICIPSHRMRAASAAQERSNASKKQYDSSGTATIDSDASVVYNNAIGGVKDNSLMRTHTRSFERLESLPECHSAASNRSYEAENDLEMGNMGGKRGNIDNVVVNDHWDEQGEVRIGLQPREWNRVSMQRAEAHCRSCGK